MSSRIPSSQPNRFGWLWLVAVVAAFFLGRYGWSATHPAPTAAPAATAEHGPTPWVAIADAEQHARRSGKPILYDFNAAWCSPCQALKRDVFSDPGHAQAMAAQVVPVSVVDRYREDGRNPPEVDALQQRFGIQAFPTLIVLSPETGRFEKTEGYGGPEATLQWVAQAVQSVGGGASR